MENSCTNWDAPHDFDSGVKPINIWGILTAAGFFSINSNKLGFTKYQNQHPKLPKGLFC